MAELGASNREVLSVWSLHLSEQPYHLTMPIVPGPDMVIKWQVKIIHYPTLYDGREMSQTYTEYVVLN